ncbi:MAG: purine-nucleoside phosphorylase [Bacteroidota bacterium]
MLYHQIEIAVNYIREITDFEPREGIILGTGLGNLAEEIEVVAKITYTDIPNFPESTVQSHKGELIFGHLAGKKVVAMAGRFHYYEGWTMQQVTFPVRVMKFLGIKRLFISNVSGSVNAEFLMGDIVLVRDHINLQPENPLRGVNDERLGPRFPDMSHTYDRSMIIKALEIAKENNIRAHTGVYLALQGPNLETPSEYMFINRIGADLVGMSTVPEVIVAKHMGLKVFVISVVSNQCYPPEVISEVTVEEVIEVAREAEPKMTLIVKGLLNTPSF